MKKLAFLVFVFLLTSAFFVFSFFPMNNSEDFVQCLVDSGVVIYVSDTCPACTNLADEFGGYDVAGELFVNCNEKPEICDVQMKTDYVPEIQHSGELLESVSSIEDFSKLTGCEI